MNPTPSRAPVPSGAGLARWTVTTITLAICGLCFAVCFGNAHTLCLSLGMDGWIAWLIGPSVDLSVIGILLGVRYLATAGYDQRALAKPRRLLVLCGLLTLALNTADALDHRHLGAAAVNAIGPVLLICWSDVGPWLVAELAAVARRHDAAARCSDCAASNPEPTALPAAVELKDQRSGALAAEAGADTAPSASREPAPVGVTALDPAPDADSSDGVDLLKDEVDLWDLTLRLDKQHRARFGRPISRDALRDELRISRDRASDLKRRLREQAAHTARSAMHTETTGQTAPRDETADLSAAAALACANV